MPSNKARITIYIEKTTKEKCEKIAKENRRSASNYINDIIYEKIKEYETEHGEIVIGGGQKIE